jgi:signal transduction histidine kinase
MGGGRASVTMSARQQARFAFGSAVVLLLVSGVSAYITILRLLENERWVIHTLQVQAALGSVDSAIAKAGRLRASYIFTTSTVSVQKFDAAADEVYRRIGYVRELVQDNSQQRGLCDQLEGSTRRRLELFRSSIKLGITSPDDDAAQGRITTQSAVLANDISSTVEQMRQTEQDVLASRMRISSRLFRLAVLILASTFILALVLFLFHYRLISGELNARLQAERAAHQSEDSLRRLTVRLLRLQDEERRKISRELHDSLGQYLAGVKMNLEMSHRNRDADPKMAEALQLLDQSIAETRMISHLLHPPLLDETGLGSAARWYTEGFARRSGLEMKVDIPEDIGRLPQSLELALFRVLQESLTNIHRHSKSARADIVLHVLADRVTLRIRDYGKGIPDEILSGLGNTGTGAGVGLAGMRERIHELGGEFNIESSFQGTQVIVTLPIRKTEETTTGAGVT